MARPKSRSFVAAYWARTTSTSSCDIAAVSRDGLLREGQDLLVLQRRLALEVEQLRRLPQVLDRELLGRLRLRHDSRVFEEGVGDAHQVRVEVPAQHVAQQRAQVVGD